MEVFGFKPGTKPGVVDLGPSIPEIGLQAALDSQMAQLQFDCLCALGEVAADIASSHVKAGYSASFAVSCH